MKRWALFALALAGVSALPAQHPPVRVRLFWTQPPAAIDVQPASSTLRLRRCLACPWTEAASAIRLSASGNGLLLDNSAMGAGPLQIENPHRIAVENIPLFTLTGPTQIQAKNGRLLIVTEIPLEEYTARVLLGESSDFNAMESLKAMAVAIRTFAARNRGRHHAEGFDVCDTTHCQDLRLAAIPERLTAAAHDTTGELLWHEGRPAATFYHRDCGGHTEAAHEAWPGERFPYLQRRADSYCAGGSGRGWRAEISKADLAAALNREGVRVPQPLDAVQIQRRTTSGRVSELLMAGSRGVPVRASTMRLAVGRQLGWTLIRSDQYEIRDAGATVVFQGRGAGHGVGLCQTGAARMGEAGHKYEEILSFYFPGTRVGVSAQDIAWRALGSARLELLTTQPRADALLVELAERMLKDAEVRFGSKARVRPQLRVYPSLEVYRDASGQPGWMAASTRGRVVRMQPAELLRRRGVLEETLRHELLHVVIESHARHGLPLWFREGLVQLLGQETGSPSNGASIATGTFSSAAEIERVLASPRDRDELERAHAAAHARVAALAKQFGLTQVVKWVGTGLPAEANL